MKASLRNICKNAGVTTGALYFFFKDKDELFRSIVEEPLHRVQDVMQQHYNFEKCALEKGQSHQHNEDEDASLQVIHLLYQYQIILICYKACHILLHQYHKELI